MTKPINQPILNEQAIAASEARFRALVTATSDIIYRMRPDWRVMHQFGWPRFFAGHKRTNNRLAI